MASRSHSSCLTVRFGDSNVIGTLAHVYVVAVSRPMVEWSFTSGSSVTLIQLESSEFEEVQCV